ncbi:MAG TPA: SusC/RagA family TonB-linked outer membrane protein, partial [Mucilaginibacter sp.]|nr:SusC/RagA family TonB-linked outer membrane protein [Mucilaginibacter sp.]
SASQAYTDQQIEWLKDPNVEYVVNAATGQYDWYYDLNQIPFMTRSLTAQQNHTIAVNGGDEKTQYLFSGGWLNQNGLFKVGPDGTDRYNARINITTNFNKWLSLDARVGYVQRTTLSPSMDVDGGSGILYNLYEIRSNYPIFFPGSDDTKYADGGSLAYPNLKDGGATTERTDAFNGVFTLQAKDIVKGLQLKAIYAPYMDNYNYNRTLRTVPLYQVSGVTTNLNPTNAYYVTKQETYRSNYQFLADYDLTIANDHHFHALAGYQFENYRLTNVAASARNLSSNDLFTLNIGDPTQYLANDQIDTWATQSVFGRLSYNYREKYFLEATARNDGSSRLAPGYRYKLFPSLSGGWRVSQEPWFKTAVPFINEFKIRGSIGNLGNSDLSNFGYYDYIALISRSTAYPFNNQVNYGYYNATLASPYKTWENINTKDIGLDMAFLSDRLNISGDYYVKRNTNMLVQVKTTAMIGIGTSQYNYADLKNSGWEARIGWRDRIGTNFSYWLNGNLSNNKNLVSTYQGRSVIAEGVNSVVEGLPLNTIWGYKAAGLYSNADEVAAGPFVSNTTGPGDIKYVDINGDGKINAGKGTKEDHGDLVNLGSTTPRYTYGFDFGFSFKGFDFSTFFQGVAKREMLINSAFTLPFVQSWRQPNQEQTDYWTPTHMDARFPRPYP